MSQTTTLRGHSRSTCQGFSSVCNEAVFPIGVLGTIMVSSPLFLEGWISQCLSFRVGTLPLMLLRPSPREPHPLSLGQYRPDPTFSIHCSCPPYFSQRCTLPLPGVLLVLSISMCTRFSSTGRIEVVLLITFASSIFIALRYALGEADLRCSGPAGGHAAGHVFTSVAWQGPCVGGVSLAS